MGLPPFRTKSGDPMIDARRAMPTMFEQDDLDLRERTLRGDRAAAETLFERHMESLYEFVHYRVGGDRQLAENVVQETLLVAFQKLGDFEGRSSLHTWLCGIAKNKIRALRRERKPLRIDDLLQQVDPEIDAILLQIETEELPDLGDLLPLGLREVSAPEEQEGLRRLLLTLREAKPDGARSV